MKIPRLKTKQDPWIFAWFFLHHPWKFHFFFSSLPGIFICFLQYLSKFYEWPIMALQPWKFLNFSTLGTCELLCSEKRVQKVPKLREKRQAYLLIDYWKWNQVFNKGPVKTYCSLEKSINISIWLKFLIPILHITFTSVRKRCGNPLGSAVATANEHYFKKHQQQ